MPSTLHSVFSPTFFHFFAKLTIFSASMMPKPNLKVNCMSFNSFLPISISHLGLYQSPAPFFSQPPLSNTGAGLDDLTTRCWTSLQVRPGAASSTRARMPAARGAAAEVPVWLTVQPPPTSGHRGAAQCQISVNY